MSRALSIAKELDAVPETGADPELIQDAADELRRQAGLIHEMIVAIRSLRLASGDDETLAAYKAARAAIKKAEDE